MCQDIDSNTFQSKIDSTSDAIILDVRTEEEFYSGAIPNATNINIFLPEARQKIEALDKDITYLVYCRSGQRSGQACQFMSQLGFEKVFNLENGIMMWGGHVVSPTVS